MNANVSVALYHDLEVGTRRLSTGERLKRSQAERSQFPAIAHIT